MVLGSGIVEIVKGVVEIIGTLVSKLFTFLWDMVKKIGDWILTSFLTLVEKLVAGLILFVVITLPDFIKKMWNAVKNFGTTLLQYLTPLGVSASQVFENLKSRLYDIFSNLISSAWNWGKDLVGNIISGIKSKVSSLVNSVKNIASTIWSYLHFSEPEKGKLADFNSWMPDMMMGLAQGINDNLYLVDRAAENVANSLGMGGTSYNYGGVVINLNVPQGANGYQMVDEIENALAQRTMRRKAVFN